MESTVVNALERKLVDAVSEVGVDINKAVTFDHLSSMLAFIPGLGLRKGEALKQAVQRKLGTVESRRSLFDKKVLAECVWKNAAGFLKITSGTVDKQLDPLDNTRIHPECYITHDFAPKICADALEVDNIPTDYFAVVETVMKRVKKTLEIRMEKHPRWIDLWENGRPIPGVTRYTETFRSKDGREHSVGIELDDILCELELGEYANDLENVYRLGKRRVQLEQIKDGLRFPWLDLRKPLQQITNEQMFEILTGETNQSLYVSLKMGFTVINIDDSGITDRATNEFVRRQKAVVKTDTGLRGYVSMFDVLEDKINPETFNIADHLQIGSHYLGVVVGVNKNRTSVDLSVKPSYLKATEAWWIERRTKESYCRKWLESCGRNPYELFDRFFNEAEALRKFSDYENELIKSSNGMNDSLASVTIGNGGSSNGPRSSGAKAGETIISRLFHHPLFANVNNKGAVEKFQREGKGTGSVIIRPSSKGANYLTITWAFQEGWYKHISVLEKGNKRSGNVGLGDELWVMEDDIKEPFSDLDEIYSRYIEPMNEFVALIVKHKVFRRGTEQLVVEAMKEQINENRERIPYFIRFDEHAAGCFILTWMNLNPNSHNPVKRELIKVRPYVS